MNRSACAIVLVALLVSGCRLASGASSSAEPSQPPTTPSVSASPSAGGISEQEAIQLATDARLNPDTVFQSATSGPFAGAVEDLEDPRIDPDQLVWAVTFAGDVDVGCEFSDCPVPGTETIVIDFLSGEVLAFAVVAQ